MRVIPGSGEYNPLFVYFRDNKNRRIDKWHHYFDVYNSHFQRFIGTPVRLLEIGVNRGGSLQMWRQYFGNEAEIFGIDIDPRCASLEEPGTRILIGDQKNRRFLSRVKRELGSVDILIDDGGHSMVQQTRTFEALYDLVSENGIYLVEDLHTSYWSQYGGGIRSGNTFIERAKGLIDSLNAWHSRAPDFGPDQITRTATGLHFYDSIMVIEKCRNDSPPKSSATGSDPFLASADLESGLAS